MDKQDYIVEALEGVLLDNGVELSIDDLAKISNELHDSIAMFDEYESSHELGTRAKPEREVELEKKICKLEKAVSFLSERCGVNVNVERQEIDYMERISTSHFGTTTESY
jgi:hypothetical protein